MAEIALGELILDFGLYPRSEVETQHVARLVEAIEAGVELPPIVADRRSKRVVDGFHRHRAYSRLYEADAKVQVTLKSYGDDSALFLDAMRLNSGHGRGLSSFDRMHCIIRAEELKVAPVQIASALSITIDRIGELKAHKLGRLHVVGRADRSVALKNTLSHMSGQSLTEEQQGVNRRLGGMSQRFYANQLIMLVQGGLIDRDDAALMQQLVQLWRLLGELLAAKETAA